MEYDEIVAAIAHIDRTCKLIVGVDALVDMHNEMTAHRNTLNEMRVECLGGEWSVERLMAGNKIKEEAQ